MSWLDRLRGGFSKTAERVADNLTGITSRAALDTATLDDIEEALIASDLGPEASHRIREAMRSGDVDMFGSDGGAVEVDETFIGKVDSFPRQARGGVAHKMKVLSLVDRTTGRARSVDGTAGGCIRRSSSPKSRSP